MKKLILTAVCLAVSTLAVPQDNRFTGGKDTWQKVGNDGATFYIPGNSLIRYGRPGRWTEALVVGTSAVCSLAGLSLTKDPAPGMTKQCDRRNGVVLALDSEGGPTTHRFGLDVSESSITAANAYLAATFPGVGVSTLETTASYAAPYSYRVSGTGAFTGDNNGSPQNPSLIDGALRTMCNVTHISHEDPIVHPGEPDSTHSHTFFGNVGIDAYTTGDNIRTRKHPNSSCIGGTVNLSAYWMPSMMRLADHSVVVPDRPVLVYYKTGDWIYLGNNPNMSDLPNGLKMVTGDANRTTLEPGVSGFSCDDSSGATVPGAVTGNGDNLSQAAGCNTVGNQLWHFLNFHQCWDGNIDSANHRSHVVPSYDTGGGGTRTKLCPADHPYVLTKISEIAKYGVSPTDHPGLWALSSDAYLKIPGNVLPPGLSGHADYMFGWDKTISDTFLQLCNRELRNCGSWNLGNGRGAKPFQGNDNNS